MRVCESVCARACVFVLHVRVCGRVGGCLCISACVYALTSVYVVYGDGDGGGGGGGGVGGGGKGMRWGGAAANAVGLGGWGTVGYFLLSDSKSESQLYEICAMSSPAVR
jgi:hypothetical protein